MTLQADFNTVTAKLDADATAITALITGSGTGTPTGTATFALPSGYSVTINADGLSSVVNQGVQVAVGNLQIWNGSHFYVDNTLERIPPIVSKLCAPNASGAVVTHIHNSAIKAKAVYNYVVNGNVLEVSVTVTNTGTVDIPYIGFRTPSIKFDSSNYQSFSNGLGYDGSHTLASGPNLSYPSGNVPCAATYVKTTAGGGIPFNFCTWSAFNPFEKFMTVAVGQSGQVGAGLLNLFFKNISVGGSQQFKFNYLFSTSTDKFVLLQPYKDALRAQLTLQHNPDARPVGQFASIGTNFIRPDNPYGYNDGGNGIKRRFDKLAGCQDFVAKVVPPMQQVNCQGMIFWQPQGINPRGVQYRPDFNVFPPETIPNLPTLVNGFNSANLYIGLLSRPGIVITSSTWSTDGYCRVNDLNMNYPANSYYQPQTDLGNRLKWAKDNGFKGFYLDSFVSDGADHNILKYIRTQIGPAMQTYVEGPTALTMPLSGAYTEFSFTNGVYTFNKGFDILKWLYPEVTWLAVFRNALPPGGYAALYDYMGQNKLTPLVQDQELYAPNWPVQLTPLQSMVASKIDANHHWI